MRNFFGSRLNYVKVCMTEPNTEGCWTGGTAGNTANAYGYLLHNGVMLTSFNGGGGATSETVSIDWNGTDGANATGNDQYDVILCFGPGPCASIQGTGPKAPGVVGPANAPTVTLMDELFSK